MLRLSICVVAMVAMLANVSFAATVVTVTNQNGAFAVSNTDFLNGITPTVTGTALGGQEGNSSNPAVLTNGAFGANNNSIPAEVLPIANNTTFTYQLNLGAAPGGYNISKIDTYSGWNDAGRVNQTYDILYSTVANPGTFIPLQSINQAGNNLDLRLEIFDNAGAFLANNVGQLRFVFGAQQNGYVGYRELDVFGTANVPEPASVALWTIIGTCGVAWCVYRRRK